MTDWTCVMGSTGIDFEARRRCAARRRPVVRPSEARFLTGLSVGREPPDLELRDGGLPPWLVRACQYCREGDRAGAQRELAAQAREIERLLESRPPRTDRLYVLARLRRDLGQVDLAEALYRRVLAAEPHAQVTLELAGILAERPVQQGQALDLLDRGLSLAPGTASLRFKRACLLAQTGHVAEALRSLEREPLEGVDPALVEGKLAWWRHYLPDYDPAALAASYRRFGACLPVADALSPEDVPDPDPERPLRVGVLSPDLCASSAILGFEPFLDGYDRAGLTVFGYATSDRRDEVTERVSGKMARLRSLAGLSPDVAAARIRADHIDVLVAIGGYVQGHGFGILGRRPAPLQVDYGAICTCGTRAIDARITDDLLDPPEARGLYQESLYALPGGFNCFRPPSDAPSVTALPVLRNGRFTFGVCCHAPKINEVTVALWSRVLAACPQAGMILKTRPGDDPHVRADLLGRFAAQGIDAERVEIIGLRGYASHLETLGRMDLLLDPRPFQGNIQTMEALWMGVPTVSLAGRTWVSRSCLTLTRRLGLEAFVARSDDEYVAKAASFARQTEALAAIRTGLRTRMLASPLCDAGRFARELEQAFRSMWRRWCAGEPL